MSRILHGLLALAAGAFTGGCALGPDYERPKVDAPTGFRGLETTAATRESIADQPWWEVFQDADLEALIREALENNYDARIAATRIEQASAGVTIARSGFFPHAGYQGGAAQGQNTFLGNPVTPPGKTDVTSSFLGALSASWEIDLWGRVRRETEASEAELGASEVARRGIWLSLVSDVSQVYFELLELDKELAIARTTVDSYGQSLKIFNERLKGGVGSKLETARAEGAQATVAASIPDLERRIGQKENQLNLLLGRLPGSVARTATLLGKKAPPEVPVGLPSALLERRPDILEAEQHLVAANAKIGVAVASFFPKIGLTAIAGSASEPLKDLAKGSSGVWGAAAMLSGPIFEGGSLVGGYEVAKAQSDEAALIYRQTVLRAFHEVSDALIARPQLERVHTEQARAVAALEEAVTVAVQRYQAGRSSYYEVLEAQDQLFPAQTALARTDLARLVVVLRLYKALGGGWKVAVQVDRR
jgi:multidrug efflux system outer membrane protein